MKSASVSTSATNLSQSIFFWEPVACSVNVVMAPLARRMSSSSWFLKVASEESSSQVVAIWASLSWNFRIEVSLFRVRWTFLCQGGSGACWRLRSCGLVGCNSCRWQRVTWCRPGTVHRSPEVWYYDRDTCSACAVGWVRVAVGATRGLGSQAEWFVRRDVAERDNVVYWKTNGKINNDLQCCSLLAAVVRPGYDGEAWRSAWS